MADQPHDGEVTDNDDETVTGDIDSDGAATLVDHEITVDEAVGVRTSGLSATSSGMRNSGPPGGIVKVMVTVDDKTHLLELDQGQLLDEGVCRSLCAEHRILWSPGKYAFTVQTTRRATRSVPPAALASQKYITEDNRHALLRHGAELILTYAPDVLAMQIAQRLAERTNVKDWCWAVQRLEELSGDTLLAAKFAAHTAAVEAILMALVVDKKGKGAKMRLPETLSVLRVVRNLVRHDTLTGSEPGLPVLMNHLGALVRAEDRVDPAVVEGALRILAAITAQHWTVSAAQCLQFKDLVPLLWDAEYPAIQTGALELMNTLAAREARLGEDSPEGRMHITSNITSPMVCDYIVANVLKGSVRSNMARQLHLLQRLLLQPLREAIETPAGPGPSGRSSGLPPRVPRRKSRPTSLKLSRSWSCEDEDEVDVRGHGGSRWSIDDGYKHLETLSLPRPVSGDSTTLLPTSNSTSTTNIMGSSMSLASMASDISPRSSSFWADYAEESSEAPPLSLLGAECLEYLVTHHASLAARAEEEEEALNGSLAVTAERLVRILGAELSLCEDPSGPSALGGEGEDHAASSHTSYQPLVFYRDVPFFHELFCRGLNLLAKTRRDMRAKTARDQDKVLRVVRRQFREALRAKVENWGQLDDWLTKLKYSDVAALWEKERVCVEQSKVLSSAAVKELRANNKKALQQLVRQQRLTALREGAFFGRTKRSSKQQRKRSPYLKVWLAAGDTALQYTECIQDGDDYHDLGLPTMTVSLSSVTSITRGRKIANIWASRRGKHQVLDLALRLHLDPADCEEKSLDLVAPDASTLEVWTDGLHMLLGKDVASKSVQRDLDTLMDMEIRLQLMELEGLSLPSEPPALPPPPPNYDFVTA